MHIIIFLGAPGSGKGTQTQLFWDKKITPSLSTGNVLRSISTQKNQSAFRLKEIIDSGGLVDDKTVSDCVVLKIDEFALNKEKIIILDGFPRNISQAQFLNKYASEKKIKTTVIYFSISDKYLINRFVHRWICSSCQSVYSIDSNVISVQDFKCTNCLIIGGFYKRQDDELDVVSKRLKIFHKETFPLIEFYRRKKILNEVDANKNENEVFASIEKLLHKINK